MCRDLTSVVEVINLSINATIVIIVIINNNCKNCKTNCQIGQVMFPHHSDQISQSSQSKSGNFQKI